MGEDSKIVVKIDGDNSGLKNSLKDTEKDLDKTAGNASSAEKAVNELSKEINSAGNAGKNLNDVAERVENIGEKADAAEKPVEELAKELDNAGNSGIGLDNIAEKLDALIDIAGNSENAVKDVADSLKNIGDNSDESGKKVITLGDLIKSNLLSDAIKRGLDEVGDKIGDFIRSGVEMASDLQEVQNVVDTTFGSGAGKIYEWADAAAESFGMSSLQAQKYNGTLGAMMKSMGLTDDAVLKMSTDMVGLAGDMASFYNLNVEEAFEKIRSGISGETEPLKQLGINMSVANLEAFALANGIETAYDKMSQAEQATLRYNYLMAQTADAQGDFAKTSDSFANQQRILQLQINDLSASLGEKLLPYLNNGVSLLNEKLPQAEGAIENIGEILGTVTGFAIEHYDAIMGVVSGYVAFQGALKAGTAITTFTGAIKTLTTATQGADTAQKALNATTAANPYVLLVSAIAAVTVGLITWANNADTVHNRIKQLNEDVEEIKKNTDEKITSDEAEIEVIRRKADRYEELRRAGKLEAGQQEELKALADELQQYMPEGTQLINEQTGAYNSLAGSIDSVIESMKKRARLSAYEDEVSEIIEKEIPFQRQLDEQQTTLDELTKKWTDLGAVITETGDLDFSGVEEGLYDLNDLLVYDKAKNDVAATKNIIEGLENEINSIQNDIDNTIKETETAASNAGISYAEAMQSQGQAQNNWYSNYYKQQVTDYENALQEEIKTHQKSLALKSIDEEEYYNWLGNYLENNKNINSELYFEQLDEYENYIEEKKAADEKAAEEQQKIAEKAEEEKKKLEEKANADALKRQEDFLEEQQKAVDEGLDEIIKKYGDQYKQLENLQNDYKKKLMSIGGELFSVEEIENEDGSKTKNYIVNNLDEQLAAMQKYHSQIKKLKDQGASNELLSELFSLGDEDGKVFADNLSKINELYNAKQKLADELSEDLYKSDAEKISAAVETELENLANRGDVLGKEAADIYAEAFKTELSEQFGKLDEIFGDTGFTANIKAMVESGAAASVPAAAYGDNVVNNISSVNQTSVSSSTSEINRLIEELNKPIQIVLDKDVLGTAMMNFNDQYKRTTRT